MLLRRACKPLASITSRLVDQKAQHAHSLFIRYHICLLNVCVRAACWWAAGGESVIVSASQLLFVAFCLHVNSVEADRPPPPCCSFASRLLVASRLHINNWKLTGMQFLAAALLPASRR